MKRLWQLWAVAVLFCSLGAGLAIGQTAPEQAVDPTLQSAQYLLRSATRVSADGLHNMMLRSLRHLSDPQMAPVFEYLATSEHPTLRIHGLLGLAECSPEKQLDLARIAQVQEPMLQAEMIGAAMDSDLLGQEQATQILAWDNIDLGVKMMVATRLVRAGKFKQVEILHAAAKSDNLGRRGMAGVLLAQLGDPAGLPILAELDKSTDPNRDQIRLMLLETAGRYEFDKVSPWALKMASEPAVGVKLGLSALRMAMRFGVPEAGEMWRQQFATAGDLARQMRLALGLLDAASFVAPEAFAPLLAHQDPMIQAIGAAGQAVSKGKGDVAGPVMALVNLNHGLSNAWVLGYARTRPSDEQNRQILLSLVDAVILEPRRNMDQRKDTAAAAVQLLCEQDPEQATLLLQPRLADPDVDLAVAEAILVGLVRSKQAKPALAAAAIEYKRADLNGLALLLKATYGPALSPQQMGELGLLVRGGGDLPPTMRLQAAWLYLQRNGQLQQALADVLP